MSRLSYLVTGVLYVLAGIPGGIFLLRGRFMGDGNPYLLLSLLGVLPGGLLILFGTGRLAPGSRSSTGLKIAYLGVGFSLFMILSLVGVALGVEPLGTSVVFCATAASYLGLVSMVFLVSALRAGRSGQ